MERVDEQRRAKSDLVLDQVDIVLGLCAFTFWRSFSLGFMINCFIRMSLLCHSCVGRNPVSFLRHSCFRRNNRV